VRVSLPRLPEARRIDVRLLLWALLVGLLAGLAGSALRWVVERLETAVVALHGPQGRGISLDLLLTRSMWGPFLLTALSVAAAIWLVRHVAPEAAGSGVQEIEGALDGVRPLRWRHVLPVKFVGGVLSLGSGMVLGREGPTIQMGGNLGGMVAALARLSDESVHVLVAAGAGAGLTAAFHAPFAGILFVIEEMRPQFRYSVVSVQAVVLACAAADVVTEVLLGGAFMISMQRLHAPPPASLALFLLFGATFGVIGVCFNRALLGLLEWRDGLRARGIVAFGVGMGALVGVLTGFNPALVGDGHHVLEQALGGRFAIEALGLLFAGRFAMTILCYGSGAPGGVFSPMLALGTLYGMAFGHLVASGVPELALPPEMFAVAGMGALFASTVRAPLTGIVLTAEITGDFQLILPLLLTCLSATLVAHALGGRPLYTSLLERAIERSKGGALDLQRPAGEESLE
jgi:CIC family chloride channel protein